MHKRSFVAAGAVAVAVAALSAVPALAGSAPRLPGSTPMCTTAQLSARLGGGDAGAGNLYRYLVLTNRGRTTCHLTGFPGVSLLDAHGRQIGPAATREHNSYAPVVLRPGASASDTIHTINHQGTCLPTSAKLRVYPPGNRAALVFPGLVTNCHHQFSVTPLAPGTQGNPTDAGFTDALFRTDSGTSTLTLARTASATATPSATTSPSTTASPSATAFPSTPASSSDTAIPTTTALPSTTAFPSTTAIPSTPASPSTPLPTSTSQGGGQVPVVPSGAPDTGVPPVAAGGGHGTQVAVGSVAGGALALGGVGLAARRRVSRRRAQG